MGLLASLRPAGMCRYTVSNCLFSQCFHETSLLCRFDAGEKPDFLKETKSVREGNWKVLHQLKLS